MNNSQQVSTLDSNHFPILEHFKTLYYLLNAKPDSQIKILDGLKKVELSDIFDINQRIVKKLSNHEVETSITTLTFILEKEEILNYNNWAEFERQDWNLVNQKISHFSINWDINIKIPNYELPQRHTLKLKIGNAIPPKDMFHLMFTSDNESDLLEAQANAVAKVDFINQIIATELLGILDNWYKGLKDVNSDESLIKKIKDWEDGILGTLTTILPLIAIFIVAFYVPLLMRLNIFKSLNLQSITCLLFTIVSAYSIASLISRFLAKNISRKVSKFKSPTPFAITKGDLNFIDKIEKENKGIISQIRNKLILTAVSVLFTFILKSIIEVII